MSPTATGAMASGSDAAKTPGQIAREAFYDGESYLAWHQLADGSHKRWERVAATCAALAAPAPVVPEEVRRLDREALAREVFVPLFIAKTANHDGHAEEAYLAWKQGTEFPEEFSISYAAADRILLAATPSKPVGAPQPQVPDTLKRALELCFGNPDESDYRLRAERLAWEYACSLVPAPSKPVGDGPEASAPPAGGGAAEGSRWDLGSDTRGEDHTLHRFWVVRRDDSGRSVIMSEPFEDPDAAVAELSRLRGGAVSLAAAPAAPEPAAGGEREGYDWRLVQMAPLTPSLMTPELGAAASQVNLAGCQLILAKQVRPVLSAPSGAVTAGGDYPPGIVNMLSADNRAMRAAGTKLAEAALRVIREYDGCHRLSLAVAEWSKALGDEGGRGERYAPTPTPANAGAEGGQA